jgi:hypothetical protein
MSNLNSLIRKYGAKFTQGTFNSLERWLLVLCVSAAVTLALCNLNFNFLEANLYDMRMTHGVEKTGSPDIVMITLDDSTSQSLDEFAPLSLDYHARFIEALEGYQPRAVGYLVDFNQVQQANPDAFGEKERGPRFVQAAIRMESQGIPVLLGTPFDVTGEMIPPFPLSSLPHAIAVVHKDTNVFAEDKITRRALTHLNSKPAFHLKLAQKLGLVGDEYRPRGTFLVPEIDTEYFLFRYHGSTVLKAERSGELPYKRISFVDILNGNVPIDTLKGKIALVGTLSREDSSDFVSTPFSKASFVNPKLLVHANILDSVLRNDGILRAPNWVNYLQTLVVTTAVILSVLKFSPILGVFATIGLAVLLMVFGHLLFQWKGLWLQESAPLIGIFVAYYLGVPYRLIREYKKRWDYQRKNEILTQVEELKTNFVQLVTHDLKTPVARIQGLAEVLLRKAAERLQDRDKETLNAIVNSTDELNRFISSILELSKVESNRLQLQRESKDINQLIERLLENFKAQCRVRNVKLVSSLEPLFPIKIDAGLISKVVSNLIDNAIKYSPADSTVTVESREIDGTWVEIKITDQGIGMSAEEMENLFTRFYRAKNDKTTEIAGTGLGLYLTKFFVEAHDGRVEVESEKGVGSTFKLLLPMQAVASEKDSSKPSSAAGARRVESVGLLTRFQLGRAAKRPSLAETAEKESSGKQ